MIKLDFEHRQSGHCESGVTSNLLNYHGFRISEPMAFGIGAGLFFSYLPFMKMQDAPTFAFRVWPGQVFKRTTRELGVKSRFETFRDEKESMDALKSAIDKGFPVGITVGIYSLPYYPPEYRTHFNGHNMVVYGYDGDIFFVSDTVMEEKKEINYKDLARIRFAKGAMAPKGRLYYPYYVPKEIDIRPGILSGIKKTANNMVGVPFPLIGVKGIRILSKKMRKWEQRLGQEKAAYYLGQMLRMEEEFGTAGAGYRYIYGAFLKEAAEVLNNPALKEISDEMGETANKWREFSYYGSRNCKRRSKPEESYDFLADLLLGIADREEAIFKKLSKI
jgi:hypothetical protein